MRTQTTPMLFTASHTQVGRIKIYRQMTGRLYQNHNNLIISNLIMPFSFIYTWQIFPLFFFKIIAIFKLFKKFFYLSSPKSI